MKITEDRLLVCKGKRHERIYWQEVRTISRNDNFLFLHLSAPEPAVERTVDIPVVFIDCNMDETEALLKEKMNNARQPF